MVPKVGVKLVGKGPIALMQKLFSGGSGETAGKIDGTVDGSNVGEKEGETEIFVGPTEGDIGDLVAGVGGNGLNVAAIGADVAGGIGELVLRVGSDVRRNVGTGEGLGGWLGSSVSEIVGVSDCVGD
jgi:hypothetical protein